jgi:Na+/proline symporter
MKVAKVTIFAIGLISILFSLTSAEMVAILGTFGWGTLMSGTFPVFIIGLLWKRANSKGVIAGLGLSLILNITSLLGMSWPGALPWYVNVITISILATVFVSLFTKEDISDEKVELVLDL